jgi:hypothetical protein
VEIPVTEVAEPGLRPGQYQVHDGRQVTPRADYAAAEDITVEDLRELDGSVDPSPTASFVHWLKVAADEAARTGRRVDSATEAARYAAAVAEENDDDGLVDE